MKRSDITNPLSWFLIITVLSTCHVKIVLPLNCYTCSDTQTPNTACLGSITCGNDEVCMNTIRDENGQHRVSKECKQTAACNTQQSQNENQCHPETSPSVCYYCCNTDLCNALEIPGVVDATTIAPTTAATTAASTTTSTSIATTEGPTTTKHSTSTISKSTQEGTTSIIPTTSTSEPQGATTTLPLEMSTNLETSKMTTIKTTGGALTSTVYQGVTTQTDGFVSCYTCTDTQTPSVDCGGSMTCGFDEVCMNTVRDENNQHRISKECKQTASCSNQQSQNVDQCHPETSPSVCYYCCNTDLCNALEIPGIVDATTVATTTAATTTVTAIATTEGATTTKHSTSTISESTQEGTSSITPTTSTSEPQGATTTLPLEMSTNLETSKMITLWTTQGALTSTVYQGITTQPEGFVRCYTCTDTQTPSVDCLGSMPCGFDEVCMNTIRDENNQHRVSKECKQTASCNNQQSQNVDQCHPETSPSVCYYCCNTDLCNAQEIPGIVDATTIATATTTTTNVASTTTPTTIAATTTSTAMPTTEDATTTKHFTSTISKSTQGGTTSFIPTSTTELQDATTTLPLEISTDLETSKMTTVEADVSTSMLQRGTTQSSLTSTANQGVITQPDGFVSCYTCTDTQTPSVDCLGSMTCGFDEVCMNTIRDENGQHRVSKECKQAAACNNQQGQNVNQCHPETSPSVCYYCCNTDLCNAQEIPGTFGATAMATTTAATTNVATTIAATTIAQTITAAMTECDTTAMNLARVRGVTFNLIGQLSIPSEEVFMTEVTESVIRCAILCRSECCMKFTFDVALNHCKLSRQELSVYVIKEGSLLYNIHEYTT